MPLAVEMSAKLPAAIVGYIWRIYYSTYILSCIQPRQHDAYIITGTVQQSRTVIYQSEAQILFARPSDMNRFYREHMHLTPSTVIDLFIGFS